MVEYSRFHVAPVDGGALKARDVVQRGQRPQRGGVAAGPAGVKGSPLKCEQSSAAPVYTHRADPGSVPGQTPSPFTAEDSDTTAPESSPGRALGKRRLRSIVEASDPRSSDTPAASSRNDTRQRRGRPPGRPQAGVSNTPSLSHSHLSRPCLARPAAEPLKK